jgi:hypothetical protein
MRSAVLGSSRMQADVPRQCCPIAPGVEGREIGRCEVKGREERLEEHKKKGREEKLVKYEGKGRIGRRGNFDRKRRGDGEAICKIA